MVGPVLQSVFPDNPGIAFVFFIAFSLMVVLGGRFAAYAFWNLRTTDLEGQAALWEYLLFVGLSASLYGVLGVVETATAVTPTFEVVATPYRDGVLLGFLLLLSLTMREIYYNDALSNTQQTSPSVYEQRRTVEMGFAVLVTGTVFGSGVLGTNSVLTVIEAISALVFAGYGLYYGRKQLTRSSVRGTMIDSLLRHLLPVVTFAVLVLIIDVSVVAGLPDIVARHVQVVFVITTATALMTSTIKLRQNVFGF
jgi:hypothetical protein